MPGPGNQAGAEGPAQPLAPDQRPVVQTQAPHDAAIGKHVQTILVDHARGHVRAAARVLPDNVLAVRHVPLATRFDRQHGTIASGRADHQPTPNNGGGAGDIGGPSHTPQRSARPWIVGDYPTGRTITTSSPVDNQLPPRPVVLRPVTLSPVTLSPVTLSPVIRDVIQQGGRGPATGAVALGSPHLPAVCLAIGCQAGVVFPVAQLNHKIPKHHGTRRRTPLVPDSLVGGLPDPMAVQIEARQAPRRVAGENAAV